MGKSDFTGTIQWNRTNPWWDGLSVATKEFVYPLTCCPMNKVQDNWNDLPIDQLQVASNCAINGNNIYEAVSKFIIKFKILFYFY